MAESVGAPPDGSDAGEVIRWYRKHRDLTQQYTAVLLNTTQSRLSKLETGALTLTLDELRFIAGKLDIPPERLGILPDLSADAIPQPELVSGSPGAPLASQQRWKAVRAELNANHAILGDLAAELYPQTHRFLGTTALTRPEWMPSAPVEIGDVNLYWLTEQLAKPTITGGIEQTETLDGCGAAEHEFAEAWLRAGRRIPSLAHLPLRRHIVDTFDLAARPALLSIATLTIRRDPIDGHRMYLHQRDAKAVASGPTLHVVPAGVFQPAGLALAHQANDFSLWRNIQREYSEVPRQSRT